MKSIKSWPLENIDWQKVSLRELLARREEVYTPNGRVICQNEGINNNIGRYIRFFR